MGGANSLDIAAVAAKFGGGGHKSAAGAELALPPHEAAKAVLEALINAMKEFEEKAIL